MFQRDTWFEIFSALKQNKLRTFLTAFSVGWGIFILIILLGAGNGLTNGTQAQFGGDAVNSIMIFPGKTSITNNGFSIGREIKLSNEDFKLICASFPQLQYKSSTNHNNQMRNMVYGKEKGAYLCRPTTPDNQFLENAKIISGRFINATDLQEYRKVCVIGKTLAETFFKKENPIGKNLNIGDVFYKVIGVFTDVNRDEMQRAYIPLATAQKAYSLKNRIDEMWLGVGNMSVAQSEQFAALLLKTLAKKHQFNINDKSAMSVNNNFLEYKRIMNVLGGIKLFVWIIGIMTLIAGIVGVSNIMIIVVKERTKEIGVRKAIGASPNSIIGLILQESILITALAGFTGLSVGWGILTGLNKIGIDSDFFKNPNVDFKIALASTLLIIIAGALAGFFPALKAAKIQPVEALRAD